MVTVASNAACHGVALRRPHWTQNFSSAPAEPFLDFRDDGFRANSMAVHFHRGSGDLQMAWTVAAGRGSDRILLVPIHFGLRPIQLPITEQTQKHYQQEESGR